MAPQTDLLQGTLNLLILKTLSLGPKHGLGIARRIEQVTHGTFDVKPGSLFPALHRLEQDGSIVGTWGESETGYRVKTYRLEPAGRRQLERETEQWKRIVAAMGQVLDAT